MPIIRNTLMPWTSTTSLQETSCRKHPPPFQILRCQPQVMVYITFPLFL